MPAVPAAVTVIWRGLASSAFGRLTVRIPSENEAADLATLDAIRERDRS